MAEGFNLANAYVQILPSTRGIKANLENAIGDETVSAGKKGGESLGAALGSTLKKVVVGLGIGKIIKDSLDAGGALQQSFGGLDTIYENAATQAKKFASEAVTAGISANDYAEQAVSFGAALKQAFGGDVAKAAQAANTAILDMADNSAKMGTDIQSIQNAYQGFAKQNYTMLDNLKLGYGGTKSEMERLLAEAEKLSGIEYNIENLGDVYDAIHVIQGDLGLTGVAAAEASTTFTGSFAAMKSAAQNLLANLTLGEDIRPALNVLGQTISTFVQNNLFPMIRNLVSALPELLSGIKQIGGELVQWVIDGITTNLPGLIEQAPEMIERFLEGFQTEATQIVSSGIELIEQLASGVKDGIPKLIDQILPMITKFTENLRGNFGKIVDAGINLILQLAQGIIQGLPTLIQEIPKIIINICGIINDNMPKILKAGFDLIVMLGKGIIESIPVIIANIGNIVKAIFSVIEAVNWLSLGSNIVKFLGDGIKSLVSHPINAIKSLITNIVDAFKSFNWADLGKNIIQGIANGIKNAAGIIVDHIKEVAQKALNAAKNFLGIASPSKVFRDQVGQWIPEGIAAGIEENISAVRNAMSDLSNGALSEAAGDINGTIVHSIKADGASGAGNDRTMGSASDIAEAVYNAVKGLYIYMDSRVVGQLVAEPVNDTLGRNAIRRV